MLSDIPLNAIHRAAFSKHKIMRKSIVCLLVFVLLVTYSLQVSALESVCKAIFHGGATDNGIQDWENVEISKKHKFEWRELPKFFMNLPSILSGDLAYFNQLERVGSWPIFLIYSALLGGLLFENFESWQTLPLIIILYIVRWFCKDLGHPVYTYIHELHKERQNRSKYAKYIEVSELVVLWIVSRQLPCFLGNILVILHFFASRRGFIVHYLATFLSKFFKVQDGDHINEKSLEESERVVVYIQKAVLASIMLLVALFNILNFENLIRKIVGAGIGIFVATDLWEKDSNSMIMSLIDSFIQVR